MTACARCFARANAGSKSAARIAMMAMTTNSSISVKPAIYVLVADFDIGCNRLKNCISDTIYCFLCQNLQLKDYFNNRKVTFVAIKCFAFKVIQLAVFAQNAADNDTDLGLSSLAQRPVNRHALADVGNQFPRDVFQRRHSTGGWLQCGTELVSWSRRLAMMAAISGLCPTNRARNFSPSGKGSGA